MTPATCWLGIDVGTQGARALVVDEHGAVIGRGARPLAGRREGNRHEQDPEGWWIAAAAACRQAMAGADPSAIAGIAVDATSGTILLADTDGTPLTPGLMYDDARADAEAKEVDLAGHEVWSRLGYQSMQPSWALPKALWLSRRHAGTKGDVRLLHQSDVITRRLVGHAVATDWSHALKTGYDLQARRWPNDVIESLHLDPAMLPEVVAPGTVLGTVGAAAEAATRVARGTPVVAGMTDGCAAQLATGRTTVGAWNSVLGTTLVLKGVSDHPILDPTGAVYCHRGPQGQWLPGGASSSGAGVIAQKFPGADLGALTARAAERPPRAVAYPLTSAAGERFPFRAPDAHTIVVGDPEDDVDRFAAYLVGLACVERLCFDHLEALGAPTDGPLTFTGGGARNAYWSQLRTDVLGRSVELPAHSEPAYGMALLAAASTGGRTDVSDMVTVLATLEPDAARAQPLREHFLDLIGELTSRGWLDACLAERALRKASHD